MGFHLSIVAMPERPMQEKSPHLSSTILKGYSGRAGDGVRVDVTLLLMPSCNR
jgi:hypothetical protein